MWHMEMNEPHMFLLLKTESFGLCDKPIIFTSERIFLNSKVFALGIQNKGSPR